ncbi:MAG TPA: hypothetical protein VFR82_04345 [Nitrospira sp.]|nr:hypothetical protein [Nitrospira sp.]
MGLMKQVRRSVIAGALMGVWLAQPHWVLGEVLSDHRVTAGRDNTIGVGTGGGTDSLSAREFRLAPSLSERNAPEQTTTPLGVPSPPHQLTPAPVLPFHPNRHLIPSPTVPSNGPMGGGHLGR